MIEIGLQKLWKGRQPPNDGCYRVREMRENTQNDRYLVSITRQKNTIFVTTF